MSGLTTGLMIKHNKC